MRIQVGRRALFHEQIPISVGEGLFTRQIAHDAFRFNMHCHPECELALVTAGSGLRYVGDSVDPFGPHDLCLIGPGVPHTWASQRGPVGSLVVQFPLTIFASWSANPEGADLERLIRLSARGLAFDANAFPGIEEDLIKVVQSKPGIGRLALLGGILARMAASPASVIRQLSLASSTPKVREALWDGISRHLHEHLAQPLTQAAMARRTGMTSSAFARAFRRRYGVSFSRHVAHLRVRWACVELKSTSRSVCDIATSGGFSSLSSFNRWFRIVTKTTPLAYRKDFGHDG